MANENKNLKKLDVENKKNVAGGDFYYRGGNQYYVADPTGTKGKYWQWVCRKARPTDVTISFATKAEAKAAADAEGRQIAEERRIAAMQQGDEF